MLQIRIDSTSPLVHKCHILDVFDNLTYQEVTILMPHNIYGFMLAASSEAELSLHNRVRTINSLIRPRNCWPLLHSALWETMGKPEQDEKT